MNIKKVAILMWVISVTSFQLVAKPLLNNKDKATYAQAEKLLNDENYSAALPLYLELDSLTKVNYNIAYKIGLCYMNAATNKSTSIAYLLKASENTTNKYKKNDINETMAPEKAYYYLAKAYQLNYDFNKAITMYLKYKEVLGTGSKMTNESKKIMHHINSCTSGMELYAEPTNVKVNNLGIGVNSKYDDYSSVIINNGNELLFTSRQPTQNATRSKKGLFDENIFISKKAENIWQNATAVGGSLDRDGNDRIVNRSLSGNTLIIFKDDGNDGNLYLSNSINGSWSSPQYWGSGINSIADETYASFTSDDRTLYFISNREGGYGGSDIYKCLKLPNGKWGPAQNLGEAVNTEYNETSIFVHPNGKEIFFSSEGHNSIGGADIFSAIIDPQNGFLSSPLNAGYPINSTGDDLYYKTSEDGLIAYLSSNKDDDKANGSMDLYSVTYPNANEQRDITLIVGRIINNTKDNLSDNLILVIDKNSHETILKMEANAATGKFGIDLPIGGNYEIQYFVKGKEIFNESIDAKKGNGYQVLIREIPFDN